jgi:hypothetical protein
MAKHPKRPRDLNQLVDLATGEPRDDDPDLGESPGALSLRRRGGLKGGPARAAKLSAERRSEIARKGAAARWRKES